MTKTDYINWMKLVESFLGFKQKKTIILSQRNSILKLLVVLNVPALIILFLVNRNIPEPYMDEYFHYRQFKEYYQGHYDVWDDKITTPPGLYHIQNLISCVTGDSLAAMRAVNWLIFGNLFLVFAVKVYEFNDHSENNITRTLNLALTPTIFFFNFLDYTDSASLALITMSFYYCLVGSAWRMGICSLLAVYVRQNNILWCAYLLVYRVLGVYSVSISSIRGNFVRSFISFVRIMLANAKDILVNNVVQISIFPLFLYYLHHFNGGKLVFGDHSNHPASFHPVQILYLMLFVVINLPLPFNDFVFLVKDTLNRLYYSRHALAAYLFLVSICIILV